MSSASEVGEAIRKLRTMAGMTQGELAEKIGVSRVSVSAWEGGESDPREENLAKLAELFKVSTAALRYPSVAGPRLVRESPDVDAGRPGRQRMAPKAYARAYQHLERMEKARVSREAIDEAERILTRDSYGQLYSGKRELTEEEQLQVVDATWKFIRDVIQVTEGKEL